jgi:hypothetical protein
MGLGKRGRFAVAPSPIRRQTLAGPSTGQGIFSQVFLLLSASPGRLVRPWRSGRSATPPAGTRPLGVGLAARGGPTLAPQW